MHEKLVAHHVSALSVSGKVSGNVSAHPIDSAYLPTFASSA